MSSVNQPTPEFTEREVHAWLDQLEKADDAQVAVIITRLRESLNNVLHSHGVRKEQLFGPNLSMKQGMGYENATVTIRDTVGTVPEIRAHISALLGATSVSEAAKKDTLSSVEAVRSAHPNPEAPATLISQAHSTQNQASTAVTQSQTNEEPASVHAVQANEGAQSHTSEETAHAPVPHTNPAEHGTSASHRIVLNAAPLPGSSTMSDVSSDDRKSASHHPIGVVATVVDVMKVIDKPFETINKLFEKWPFRMFMFGGKHFILRTKDKSNGGGSDSHSHSAH